MGLPVISQASGRTTGQTTRLTSLISRSVVVAGNLAKWLALARTGRARSADLKSVHVVGIDGREQVVVVRRDRPNPLLETTVEHAVREALGNDPRAMEVLGQLLAEYADNHTGAD